MRGYLMHKLYTFSSSDRVDVVIDVTSGETFLSLSGYLHVSKIHSIPESRAKQFERREIIAKNGNSYYFYLIPERLISKWLQIDNPQLLSSIQEKNVSKKRSCQKYLHSLVGYSDEQVPDNSENKRDKEWDEKWLQGKGHPDIFDAVFEDIDPCRKPTVAYINGHEGESEDDSNSSQNDRLLNITEHNGELIVDSRLVAEKLGINHRNFRVTIEKYQTKMEQDFGHLAFETQTVENSAGAVNKTVFYYLNENQATFLMTLSRNTEQVVDAKLGLVKSFSEAKKQLAEKNDRSKPDNQDLRLQVAEALNIVADRVEQQSDRLDEFEKFKLETQKKITELEGKLNTPEKIYIREKSDSVTGRTKKIIQEAITEATNRVDNLEVVQTLIPFLDNKINEISLYNKRNQELGRPIFKDMTISAFEVLKFLKRNGFSVDVENRNRIMAQLGWSFEVEITPEGKRKAVYRHSF